MKKLALLLVLALLMSNVSALAATVSPANEFPITDEVIELSFLNVDYWNMTQEDFVDNLWLRELEEKTNIHLNVTPIPSTDATTKRNLMLASGNYPGIIGMSFTRNEIMQYGVTEGILVDIKDYIEEYGYELEAIFEYNPTYYTGLIAPDGAIYGIPNIDEGFHTLAYPKLYVRQDWLDALEMDMPQDTESFREMLRAFVSNDLNGNGIADEIGISGGIVNGISVQWAIMSMSFVNCRPDFWLYEDLDSGEIIFAPGTEDYRDGLRYLKSLYDEGLIDPASFTQTNDQLKVTIRTEPYSAGAFVVQHIAMGVDSNNIEEYKNYQVLSVPLMGPNGFQETPKHSSYGEVGNFGIVVTDTCENVSAAVRLIDYFMGEEQTITRWLGQEGVDWEKVDPSEGLLSITGDPLRYRKITGYEGTGEEKDFYRNYCNVGFKSKDLAFAALSADTDMYDPASYEQRIALDTMSLAEYTRSSHLPASIFINAEDTADYGEIQTNLNDFIAKSCVQFILGERDIETGWDQYLSELDRYNVSRYVELYSDAYKSVYKD